MSEERQEAEAPYPFFVLTPKSLAHWCAEVVYMEELFRTSNEALFPGETICPNALVAHPSTWRKMLIAYRNAPHPGLDIKQLHQGRVAQVGRSFVVVMEREEVPETEIHLVQCHPEALDFQPGTSITDARMWIWVAHHYHDRVASAELPLPERPPPPPEPPKPEWPPAHWFVQPAPKRKRKRKVDPNKPMRPKNTLKRDGSLTKYGWALMEKYARSWLLGYRLMGVKAQHPELCDYTFSIRTDDRFARHIAG